MGLPPRLLPGLALRLGFEEEIGQGSPGVKEGGRRRGGGRQESDQEGGG